MLEVHRLLAHWIPLREEPRIFTFVAHDDPSISVDYHEPEPRGCGRATVFVGYELLELASPEPMVTGLVHAARHAFQTEVINARRPDDRLLRWRRAWCDFGEISKTCPPADSPLEADALRFTEDVGRGYRDEIGRQLTIAEASGDLRRPREVFATA